MTNDIDAMFDALRGASEAVEFELDGASLSTLVAAVWSLLLRVGGPEQVELRVEYSGRAEQLSLLAKERGVLGEGIGSQTSTGAMRTHVRKLTSSFGSDHAAGVVRVHVAHPAFGGWTIEFYPRDDGVWIGRGSADESTTPSWQVSLAVEHLAAFVQAEDRETLDSIIYLTPREMAAIQSLDLTGTAAGPDMSIDEAFERNVALAPDATALVQGNVRMTYIELDEHANAVAADLIGRGITVGDRVGVAASRSVEFVVAAMAVLKAGAAYVPLDTDLPRHRLSEFAKVSAVKLILTESLDEDFAMELGIDSVLLPEAVHAPRLARDLFISIRPKLEAARLAYVIFTSGSSGQPKAVLLDHAGRTTMFADLNRKFGVSSDDKILMTSSTSFDMSVSDIFGTLAAGACVVFPDRGKENEVSHWVDLVRGHRVSMWHSVPTSLTLFLNVWSAEFEPTIRLFVVGGDWIPLSQPHDIRRRFPAARVVSLGGATEVSVDSVMYEVAELDPTWRSVPYGRPLAGQSAIVLDADGHVAGIGHVGELVLGGAGVAWGYESNPRLTAAKFVCDRLSSTTGGRAYRTGDLARVDGFGQIELLGRIDLQIKIDGLRVDLSEIEAHIRRSHVAKEAVVVLSSAGPGLSGRLMAYVTRAVGADGLSDDEVVQAVRSRIIESLPGPMIPSRIVVLETLPLNRNGKVDRKSLESNLRPEPTLARLRAEAKPYIAGIAEAWREVLGLDYTPSSDVRFFDIGGSSMAAIQVAARLSARFGREIALARLARAETVEEVAYVVANAPVRDLSTPTLRRRDGPAI